MKTKLSLLAFASILSGQVFAAEDKPPADDWKPAPSNQAGKQFETAFYPGGLHGIGGGKLRAQLFTRITNFILDKL